MVSSLMLIVVERRETFHYYYPMGVHPPGDLTVTFIARHLLHTLNVIVVGSFTTPHHYCPMCVQPLSVLTVTGFLCFYRFERKEPLSKIVQPGVKTHTNRHGNIFLYLYSLSFQ